MTGEEYDINSTGLNAITYQTPSESPSTSPGDSMNTVCTLS
jgi:hypothetical protein